MFSLTENCFCIVFCYQLTHNSNRGLGTHISFVRSVTMDNWTEKQMKLMKAGGNQQCKEFLKQYGIPVETASIREKYDSPPAQLYKQVLLARIEGKPEPTELPKGTSNAASRPPRRMEGFGSSPPPSPPSNHTATAKRLAIVAVPVVAATALWFLIPH